MKKLSNTYKVHNLFLSNYFEDRASKFHKLCTEDCLRDHCSECDIPTYLCELQDREIEQLRAQYEFVYSTCQVCEECLSDCVVRIVEMKPNKSTDL